MSELHQENSPAVSDRGRQQREVFYTGCVQGVGFRYTVRSLATRFKVSGFVRNLRDGRVQLVVEGDADEIQRFLQAVRDKMAGYIAEVKETIRPPTGRFQRFEIVH